MAEERKKTQKEEQESTNEKKEEKKERAEKDSKKKESRTKKSTKESSEKTKESKDIDRKDLFRTGDTVRVVYRITEAGKERLQPYEGIVIAKKGKGVSKTFTVRRVGVGSIGVERIFPLYSPKIAEIEVVRRGKVNKSKLYYLRKRRGRRESKVRERSASK